MPLVRLPQRGVFLPDPLDELLFLDALDRLIDGRLVRSEVFRLAIVETARDGVAPRLDHRHERHEGFIERAHAVGGELRRDLLEAEPLLLELPQNFPRRVEILLDREPHLAVIFERVVCGRGKRVNRVARDQRLDVQHVAVLRILRPRRCPQRTLHIGAPRAELLKSIAAEVFLEELIRELGVRDGHFAEERFEITIAGFFQFGLDLLVRLRVDAADKETGH